MFYKENSNGYSFVVYSMFICFQISLEFIKNLLGCSLSRGIVMCDKFNSSSIMWFANEEFDIPQLEHSPQNQHYISLGDL